MRLKLPGSVGVELKYPYLESPIVYVFPLRQARDAELEERERLFGNGRKMKPADRLAALVEDVQGLESLGLAARGPGEDLGQFRSRVAEFFSSEDGQELAEHAVLYRGLAVSPQSTFCGSPDSQLAVDIRSQEAGRPVLPLSDVRPEGKESEAGVSDLSTDEGSGGSKAEDPG